MTQIERPLSKIVACGTPREIKDCEASITGSSLEGVGEYKRLPCLAYIADMMEFWDVEFWDEEEISGRREEAALAKGEAKGRAEGRAEGEAKNRAETARLPETGAARRWCLFNAFVLRSALPAAPNGEGNQRQQRGGAPWLRLRRREALQFLPGLAVCCAERRQLCRCSA